MRINLPVVVAAAFLLAACSSASEDTATTDSTGGAPQVTSGSNTNVTPVPVGPPPGSPADFTLNVGDTVLFGFDQSTLTAEGRTTVERWAAFLETYPANKMLIEGHADERGTREYNLALGERRANASREYLVSLGIDPNRLRTVSYGKERPINPGSSEAAYAQNRRAFAVVEPTTN